jgi:hypothetical protein
MENEFNSTRESSEPTVPGTGLTEGQWRLLERELQTALSDRFTKVWLQVTRLRSVCVTAFLHKEDELACWPMPGYRIFTFKNVRDFNLESLVKMMSSQL